MTELGGVEVIVVPDDNAEAKHVPPGILAMLGPTTMLMANDSRRMYVRRTQWESMKDSFKLTAK